MSASLRGCGLITRRIRDVLAVVGQHPSSFHLPSSFSSLCLLHYPPPSLHLPERSYTLHQALPRQSCFLNSASLSPLPASPAAWISTSPITLKTRSKVDGGPPENKPRQVNSPTITLIDTEDKVSTMSLNKAERLAKQQDLKLVKVEDPDMQRSSKLVYKLMTGKQYFEEQINAKRNEKKSSTGGKDEKILAVGGKITQHDLAVKLHSVTKWLSKGHQIKVTISSRKATKEDVENIFSTIEEEVKKVKGRILQRHEKMEDIRFYIAPLKEPKGKETVTNRETTHSNDHVQSNESSDGAKQ